jgi:hypothetical protein
VDSVMIRRVLAIVALILAVLSFGLPADAMLIVAVCLICIALLV